MKKDTDSDYSKRIPSRIVKSRKPSPVVKSGVPSKWEDATVETHVENLIKFVKSNTPTNPELIDR